MVALAPVAIGAAVALAPPSPINVKSFTGEPKLAASGSAESAEEKATRTLMEQPTIEISPAPKAAPVPVEAAAPPEEGAGLVTNLVEVHEAAIAKAKSPGVSPLETTSPKSASPSGKASKGKKGKGSGKKGKGSKGKGGGVPEDLAERLSAAAQEGREAAAARAAAAESEAAAEDEAGDKDGEISLDDIIINSTPCKHFMRGRCQRGDKCKYLHEKPAAAVPSGKKEKGRGKAEKGKDKLDGSKGKGKDTAGKKRKQKEWAADLDYTDYTTICWFFKNSVCQKGDACEFMHPMPAMRPGPIAPVGVKGPIAAAVSPGRVVKHKGGSPGGSPLASPRSSLSDYSSSSSMSLNQRSFFAALQVNQFTTNADALATCMSEFNKMH